MCLLYSVLSFAAVVICAETEVPVRAIAHLVFEYLSVLRDLSLCVLAYWPDGQCVTCISARIGVAVFAYFDVFQSPLSSDVIIQMFDAQWIADDL